MVPINSNEHPAAGRQVPSTVRKKTQDGDSYFYHQQRIVVFQCISVSSLETCIKQKSNCGPVGKSLHPHTGMSQTLDVYALRFLMVFMGKLLAELIWVNGIIIFHQPEKYSLHARKRSSWLNFLKA